MVCAVRGTVRLFSIYELSHQKNTKEVSEQKDKKGSHPKAKRRFASPEVYIRSSEEICEGIVLAF